MKLLLIRHGDVGWNKKGFLSYTDLGLTKLGFIQAKKVAETLKKEKIDVIYCSPLKRCVLTAETIAKELKTKFIVDERLKEVNFGIFEGLTVEEAKRKFPKIFSERIKNKWKFRIPGGESYEDAAKRVMSLVNEVKGKYSLVVFVTHATIIKILLKELVGKSLEEVENYYYKPGSVIVIELK
jgi:alpha-ribazole phosphatase